MIRHIASWCLVLGVTWLGAAVLVGQPAAAQRFDPGHIISDALFTNSSAMSAEVIQRFLDSKGAHCRDGQASCLKHYREGGKSAATIIAETAQRYAINPQVLIVTLQKEVGLVTANRPEAWRYRSAMGYGCPDSTPGVCHGQFFGFSNQLNWAARMFRSIMNNSPTWYTPYRIGVNTIMYHPNAACGRGRVTISNRATVALYSYTPYQPNAAALTAGWGGGDGCSSYGNRNFWLYFNAWFGASTSSLLIQSPRSPAVYLQSGDTRYALPSWRVVEAFGLGRFGVTAVSDQYMDSLADGGILGTTFSNKARPGPVYLADNGHRFGFASQQQCLDWGFADCTNPARSKPLEPAVFDKLHEYGAISSLMLHGSHVYLIHQGHKHPFLTHQARVERGYGAVPHTPITNPLNTTQAMAGSLAPNHSLVSIANTPVIYAYADGQFYGLGQAAFRSLANSGAPLLIDRLSRYTTRPPSMRAMVGDRVSFGDGTMQHFVAGGRVDLSAARQEWPPAPRVDGLRKLVDRVPRSHQAGPQATYRTQTGTIFAMQRGQRRDFYSLADYFALGHRNPVPVSDGLIHSLPSGQPILAPGHGSLYQLASPRPAALVFTTSVDGSACRLHSLSQIAAYNLKSAPVQRLASPPAGPGAVLDSLVYDQHGNLHLVTDGRRASIKASDWGLTRRLTACSLHSDHLATLPSGGRARFVRNPTTGLIYHNEAGQLRPIHSYAAFLRLGGTAANTYDITAEFLAATRTGQPIR